MRIGEVIGRVTLNRAHPAIQGAIWKLVVPLTAAGLSGQEAGRGEPLVVFDELGSGPGSLIAISDGAEAAAPFHPDLKPLDAYCSAILDDVSLEPLNPPSAETGNS